MLSVCCKLPRVSDRNSDDKASSSTSVIANNNDLLVQILLCLPVKSLMSFKSVSKCWLSLISDPFFIHRHSLQNRHSVLGLFLPAENAEFEFIFLDGRKVTSIKRFKILNFDVNNPTGLKIEQSCNGLLCCSNRRWSRHNRTYYINNPSTKQSKVIPKPHSTRNGLSVVCSMSLAFNPLKSPHYKVVCVCGNSSNQYQIHIFDSKTDSWKISDGEPLTASYDTFSRPGVFWNGSLHWISASEFSSWIVKSNSFVYFDVEQELVKELPVPPLPDNDDWLARKIGYFGEYNGHLHLVPIYNQCSPFFDILEMDIDYRFWNVKYRVDMEILATSYPEMIRYDNDSNNLDGIAASLYNFEFSILLIREEKEEESSLVIHILDKIICYNLKEMSFTKTHDLSPSLLGQGQGSIQYAWFDAHQYIESLALV